MIWRTFKVTLDVAAYFARKLMDVLIRVSQKAVVLLLVATIFTVGSLATTISAGLFGLAASLVENATELRTVRRSHQVDVANRDRQIAELTDERTRLRRSNGNLAASNRQMRSSNDRLIATGARQREVSARLLQSSQDNVAANRQLRQELASVRARPAVVAVTDDVVYRGRRMRLTAAVSDTRDRVTRRVTRSSAQNIGSMAGESIPFWGIAIVVAATSWELADSCNLMTDLYELDVAMNPENAIDTTEVCGLRVPTKEELWAQVRKSPGAIWGEMKGMYTGLAEFEVGDAIRSSWTGSRDWVGGFFE